MVSFNNMEIGPFKDFKNKAKDYYLIKNINIPSDEFIYWFIGFTEGDGCFSINKRKELTFILTQGVDNIKI